MAFFNECIFEKSPNFYLSVFGRFTTFEGTKFKEGGEFISSIFQGHLFLNSVLDAEGKVEKLFQSDGKLDFTWAYIYGPLTISDSIFLDDLVLNQVNIGGMLIAEGAVFLEHSTLILTSSQIRNECKIVRCSFKKSENKCADFGSTEFLGGLIIQNCSVINGKVSLYNAKVLKDLLIGEYKEEEKSNPHESFNITFNEEVNFSDLQVDGSFSCYRVNYKKSTNCADILVKGQVYLMTSKFEMDTNFNRSEFAGIFGTNSIYEDIVRFEGSKFRKAVRFLDGCHFKNGAEFYFAQFEDEVNFGGAKIAVNLSLKNTRFRHSLLFELKNIYGPSKIAFDDSKTKTKLDLHACTYETMLFPDNFKTLDDFINRMPKDDRSTWIFFEQFLRRTGRIDNANKIRRYWNTYEGEKTRLLSFKWIEDKVFRYLTRYGTSIWIIVSIVFLLILGNDLIRIIWEKEKWTILIHTALNGLAVAGGGVAADALRRRTWPE